MVDTKFLRLLLCLSTVLAVIVISVSPIYAQCISDEIDILVKTSFTTYFVVADQYCNTTGHAMLTWNMLLDSFDAASPGPNIAHPGSEPSHTVMPYTARSGFFDDNNDEAADAAFTFATHSLHDVGVYYTIMTGTYTDGFYIYPLEPDSFASEVTNWPPTASPSISGTLRVGETCTLHANSEDNDYGMGPETGSLSHRWEILQPIGHSATLSSPNSRNPDIHFIDEDDIGDWQLRVQVDDNEGERITEYLDFYVEEVPPDVDIMGNTDIDVLTDIHLWASRTDDIDGGPPLVFHWDIIYHPTTVSLDLGTIPRNNHEIIIPTTGPECGEWQFQLTSSDNEGLEDDVDVITVTVHNIMPDITVTGDNDIVVDDHIHFTVSPMDDPDGGTLDVCWVLIQAPNSSGYIPGEEVGIGETLDIPTNSSFAGTWIFDVHVQDDETFEPGEYSERIQVLVDDVPEAHASGDDIVSLFDPVELNGSASFDPDSDNPHTNIEGAPVLSPGIVDYDWWVIEVPYDLYGTYFPGPVEEVFGAANGGSILNIAPGMLDLGNWTFELTVTDGEGNTDSTTIYFEVVDPDSAPIALVPPSAAYYTDVDGYLDEDIILNGCASFDPDDLLSESYIPGLGITNYRWVVVNMPPLCSVVPTLPAGLSSCLAALFTSGSTISPECQGGWLIGLEVTDNEANTDVALSLVLIGNCPDQLCIDYPTTDNYEYVEFTEETDIVIYYHLDSLLYDNLAFADGMRLELAIFHEDDPVTPVYNTHYDYDLLPTDKGGFLTFHWHGYTNTGERPLPGKYTIYIFATTPTSPTTVYEAVQNDAIWIEVVDVEIDPTSDTLLSINGVEEGTDVLYIDYQTSSHFTSGDIYDEARLIIKETSTDTVVYDETFTPPFTGSIEWDGVIVPPDMFIAPAVYTAQIEVFKEGRSLGISPEHTFIAYEFDFDLDTIGEDEELDPGALLKIGDNTTASITLRPDDASLAGDVFLLAASESGAVEVLDSGVILPVASGATFTAADVMPAKTLEITAVDSSSGPTELVARFEPLGGTSSKIAEDRVAVTSVDLDIGIDSNNDGVIDLIDDSIEDSGAGMIMWVNADDDDSNGVFDKDDPGGVSGENDLMGVELTFAPETLTGKVVLTATTGGSNIRVWDTPTMDTEIPLDAEYVIGTDFIPDIVYVEGLFSGETHLAFQYKDESDTVVFSDNVYITVIEIDLDVDTDRSGIPDALDEEGEDNWTGALGAIITCNNDNDNPPDTVIDKNNSTIDGSGDNGDLRQLLIPQWNIPHLPSGWQVVLAVTSHHLNIRIFDELDVVVLGSGAGDIYTIPDILSGDLLYRMEALSYADTGFNPALFNISLRLLDAGSNELYRDEVQVRVAPFTLHSNLDAVTTLYVVHESGNAASDTFVAALTPMVTAAGATLVEIDAASYLSSTGDVDQWAQDQFEIGYSEPGGNPFSVVLKSPRVGGLHTYPRNELLGPDFGFVERGVGYNSLDSFGNLECSPRVTVGTTEYPLGRIIYGGDTTPGGTGRHMNNDVVEFLEAQYVQEPLEVYTDWLYVGHVDEIISFVPFPGAGVGDKNFKVLIASPRLAIDILEAQPDHSVVITPLGETFADILADWRYENTVYQANIDIVREQLRIGLNLTDPDDFIEIPVYFREIGGRAIALLPNMVNLISINGHLIVAEPFVDPFKNEFNTRLNAVGFVTPPNPGANIHYIDDWDYYHFLHGEVHCGTNTRRTPPTGYYWWDRY